jgi:hypothetical protein
VCLKAGLSQNSLAAMEKMSRDFSQIVIRLPQNCNTVGGCSTRPKVGQ